MESVSGVKCGIAQGGSCGVRTHGKTRFRARDAPSRDTATWALLQGTAAGYRHSAPVTGHRHGSLLRRYSHNSTSQRHINKDTPDDFSSGVSEERQLPTLPPGLAVPSAMTGLASLFGMGRGGSPSL